MTKRKKITPKQRILMQLAIGETHTESRLFDNPADVARVQSALMQSAYRYMRRAKDYGDNFKLQIYSAMGRDGYALFAVMTKTEIGLENPFLNKNNDFESEFSADDL